MISKLKAAWQYIWENRLTRSMFRYFDWPLFLIVVAISLFGIVCVFSATSSEVTEYPSNIMEMLETQSIYYPRLQLMWLLAGIFVIMLVAYPPYQFFGNSATWIYLITCGVLVITLVVAEVGRGGMQAFLSVGSRGFQPSEIGKVSMIICFAKVFSDRRHNVKKFGEFLMLAAYMAIPTVLVILQPDFGTAMVYIFTFCVLIFISGTDTKLLATLIGAAVVLAIPVWYAMNNTSAAENFRLTRFLIWLDPESYPDEARQVINAQIAVGSGGLFGKGVVSPGSFASLGYISDDHTDFIFAIVCESFGLVGGCALVAGYMILVGRLIWLAVHTPDPYGAHIIVAVTGVLLFHIIENLCMVIGLLPVTGIPLPFVSYGGSNMLTNMAAIGLVQNVVIRTKKQAQDNLTSGTRTFNL